VLIQRAKIDSFRPVRKRVSYAPRKRFHTVWNGFPILGPQLGSPTTFCAPGAEEKRLFSWIHKSSCGSSLGLQSMKSSLPEAERA
jgi:hypothetical protein